MYFLTASAAFDSAHFLSGYEGKCGNLHGHRWQIEAEVCGEDLKDKGPARGMVVDFKDIKVALKTIADELDHAFIYEEGTLGTVLEKEMEAHGFKLISVTFRPTAECFSKWIFDRLMQMGLPVYSVTVYETPTNKAIYKKSEAQ